MFDLLFQRLTRYIALTQQDREKIKACAWRLDHVPAYTDLMQEGDKSRLIAVALDGWACRYKQLKNGRRQITALFLPGDMCDPCVILLGKTSHALSTLTPSTVLRLPEREMRGLLDTHPALIRAFWLDTLVSEEVQREWTVSLGRRSAIERMAHLFCELLVRLRAVGRAHQDEYDLPITQADLGDALGLSSVHVNRTLQQLRVLKLIELRGKRLIVHDEGALKSLALFDSMYLMFSPCLGCVTRQSGIQRCQAGAIEFPNLAILQEHRTP